MQTVNVATFRNMTDRLNRQVRVDYHACVGKHELTVWAQILRRTLAEAGAITCTRTTAEDKFHMAQALTGATNQLSKADL